LPVTVTHRYELNGQQVSSSQVITSSLKGAVLLVSNKVANVTKKTATVHHMISNGARQRPPDGSPIA
jgi:hypothetical protein